MLTSEVIESESGLADLVPEWEHLHSQTLPRLPFLSPLWATNWWRYYKRNHITAQDHLFVLAFRDEKRALVAVAPMVITHRPGFSLPGARELQFFGADTNVTEVRGPLCRLEHTEFVIATIASYLDGSRRADWVQWRGLRPAAHHAMLPKSVVPVPAMDTAVHLLHVPNNWDEFRAALPRNMKEALRKCYNSLSRNNVTFEFRVVQNPSDTRPAIERFLELHELRSENANSVTHANVFSTEASRSFLHAYCHDLAEQGALRIFQIVIGDKVVATRIAFVFGDELYLYYSGYDVTYGQYSIMTTVVAEAIKWAIANRFRTVNLSSGSDVSKTRWRPEVVTYYGGVTARSALLSRSWLRLMSRLRGWQNLDQGQVDPALITGTPPS